MKNKKVFVTVAVSLCLLIIASLLVYNYNYGKIKAQKYSESITQAIEVAESNVNFETTVQNSTAAVTAEFVSYREDKDYMTYKFKVIDILYGKVTESEIEFRLSNMGNGVDQFGYNSLTFNEGDKYIIPLTRRDDLFFDTPQYSFVGMSVIPYGTIEQYSKENNEFAALISEKYGGDLALYFKETEKNVGHSKERTKNIFREENLETVVKNTDILLKVKVNGVLTEGTVAPTTTYTCEVLESVNGVSYKSDSENGLIYVTCFKNSLKIGKEYVIALCRSSDKSLIYTQAADNGIISVDDTETIEQIKIWLSETE